MHFSIDFNQSCRFRITRSCVTNITASSMITAMNNYRLAGMFTDTIVKLSNNTTVPVHGLVMSAYSDVILAALSSGFIEATTREIDMSPYDPACAVAVIDYAYGNEITITPDTVLPILEIAHVYNIKQLIHECIRYICDSIDDDNLEYIMYIAKMISSDYMISRINAYISSNIDKKLPEYLSLSIDQILPILSYNINITRYEQRKRKAICRLRGFLDYIVHDVSNRIQYLNRIISDVPDIQYVPPRARLDILESYPDIDRSRMNAVYDSIHPINDFEVYTPNSLIAYCVYSPGHMRLHSGDITDLLTYPPDYKSISKYGYIVNMKLYFQYIFNTRTRAHDLILNGMVLCYSNNILVTLGCTTQYMVIKIVNLSVTDDERIVQIYLDISHEFVHRILVKSNKNTYGPYGVFYATERTVRVSALPPECENRTDVYLQSIAQRQYVHQQHRIRWEYKDLIFTWIQG